MKDSDHIKESVKKIIRSLLDIGCSIVIVDGLHYKFRRYFLVKSAYCTDKPIEYGAIVDNHYARLLQPLNKLHLICKSLTVAVVFIIIDSYNLINDIHH